MASEFKTFRLRLRAETASAHQKLEEQLKSTGLTGSKDDYAGMLSSFLRFYRPLEAALGKLEWQPHGLDLTARRKSSWLEGDLRALGHQPDNIIDWPNLPTLKSASDGLGALYVIEGASLGGQVIGRWLANELDINTNNGGRFFASYGAQVGEMWRSFLEVLERAAGIKSNADSIEQSAIDTFECFHDCLCAQHQTLVPQTPSNAKQGSMSTPVQHPSAATDLSSCDREPIQIPGSIQPHGAILVLVPNTLHIAQAGGDTIRFLGRAHGDLIGTQVAEIFTAEQLKKIETLRSTPARTHRPSHIFIHKNPRDGFASTVTTHQAEGALIFEFEENQDEGQSDFISIVQEMVRSLQSTANRISACQSAAEEVRAITNFDRVVVYRFLSDGAGVVDAEAKRDGMESFKGLRFPAGDIPPQARELYLKNWIRVIPDAQYKPCPLFPVLNPATNKPLDMSFCALRSVSPVHLEYLANMNVRASMSLSLILQGRLWGLIACHHETPIQMPYQRRVALELFAQMASYILETKIAEEELAARMRTADLHDDIVASLSKEDDLVRGLTDNQPNLLSFISAEGVIVWMDGQMVHYGQVPSHDQTRAFVGWLNESAKDGVFHTDCLPLIYPPARDFKRVASGALALSVSRTPRDYVIWFRPEIVETVRWAGNPVKTAEEATEQVRLSPRKSFAAWEEKMQMRSEPWSNVDIQTAQALRVSLLEVVLHRIDQVAREKEAARARQEILLEELDRRILQWELTARELKLEGDRRALIEAELSQVLRRTVIDQENERRRIARELHDSLGQYLTIMQLEFDHIARGQSSDTRVSKGIQKLKELASSVGNEINRLAWEIRPTSLDDLGLQTAVEQLVQEWCEQSNLQFDLQLMLNDRRLPPTIETTFYRVLQETINNVVKHADATKVGIILEANDENVSLIVEDNGRGFAWDPDAPSSSTRLGLLGMRERLALVGGQIEIESGHDKGTTVIVHAPI